MKAFGGNSGYIGYSESVRSAMAKEAGSFPKTEFKAKYRLTDKQFKELLERKIIVEDGWHHTSKFGNHTPFYKIHNLAYYWLYKGDKERAYYYYLEAKAYDSMVKRNQVLFDKIRQERYLSEIAVSKQDRETIDFLKSVNMPYRLSKRNNYFFTLKKELLSDAKVRELFSKKM